MVEIKCKCCSIDFKEGLSNQQYCYRCSIFIRNLKARLKADIHNLKTKLERRDNTIRKMEVELDERK